MERREFIKNSLGFCAAAALFSLDACAPGKNLASEYENGKLKIKKSDFGEQKWAVLNTTRANAPIMLSKREDGSGYDAVLMLCTHKQCEVKPAGTVLSCPCHGAEFAFNGKVLKEPANTDLKVYQTSTDANFIYIHL